MRFKIIILLFACIVSSQQLAAESWAADKVYHSGDIVEFKGKYYLAGYWNKRMQPIDNKIVWDGWISIKNHRIAQWKPHKAYRPGRVVKFNEENYIAKWWNKNSAPDTDRSPWVKLTVGIGQEPGPDDKNNVLGRDKDDNGIRDSYERFIEKKYTDPILKSYLKTAAREYQKVLELHLNPDIAESMTTEQATQMMNDLVTFMFCNRKLRKEGRLPLNSSPISEYYNTIERAIARHKGERVIYKKNIDESFNAYIEPNVCGSLFQGGEL